MSLGGGSRRNSSLVAAGILLSRLTGLARERAIGHFFGTSFAADAWRAAFRVPNLLQNLLGEGVLSASFIPVYSRLLADCREEEAGRVAGAIAGLLALTAGGLALLGAVLAAPLTHLLAPGLPERTFELTVPLLRLLFPATGLLVLSAWCLGVLNSHRRFFLSYVAPVLLNVTQIAVLVVVGATVYRTAFAEGGTIDAQRGLITWLAVGTIVGGGLQFLVQLPSVLRVTRGLRPSLRTDLPGVRATVRAFVPVVAGRGVVQLSAYLDLFLASFLAVGAIAALGYAQVLYVLPISLFGMSVAAAELPELSSLGPGDARRLAGRVDEGLGRIAFLVVPTAVGYLVVGDLLVGGVFQTGEFDRLVTVQVWLVLVGYTVGLLASSASRLLQSALYGIGDPRTPARVAAARVVVSALLGVAFMLQLDRVIVVPGGFEVIGDLPAFSPLETADRITLGTESGEHLGAVGLSLAAGLAAWLELTLLHRAVARSMGRVRMAGGQLIRIVAAALIAGAVAWLLRPSVDGLHPLLAGAAAVSTVAVVYLAAAAVLRVPEVRDLGRFLSGWR